MSSLVFVFSMGLDGLDRTRGSCSPANVMGVNVTVPSSDPEGSERVCRCCERADTTVKQGHVWVVLQCATCFTTCSQFGFYMG